MIIHGREIGFLRTVYAVSEVAKVCPKNDISKFTEVLKNSTTVQLNDVWATFVVALNTGYEMAQFFEDPSYKKHPLTKDEVYSLTEDVFTVLINEATQTWLGDIPTVEAESPKKKEKISETSD